MSQGIIARRYAKALMNLADKSNDLINTGLSFSKLSEVFKDSTEMREVLSDTKISSHVKQKILKDILIKIKAPELVDKFSRYILFKRRFSLLPEIERAFNFFVQEKLGRIEARVTVAHDLQKGDVGKLEKAISKYSGKEVKISINVDPEIIGGIVTRIGSIVIDGSINNQLNNIRKTIIRG